MKLIITEFESNSIQFNLNGLDYKLDTQTDSLYEVVKGDYQYVDVFDQDVLKLLKKQANSFKNYNNKLNEAIDNDSE